jgi:hypothetical protein
MRLSENSPAAFGIAEAPFHLSRTHYIQLLKVKNEDEGNFYEIEASENNWSVSGKVNSITALFPSLRRIMPIV